MDSQAGRPKGKREKPKGHGRNGADDFPKARRVPVALEGEASGEPCPHCPNGKVYPLKGPSPLLRIVGVAPIQATVYELERRRCNLCGQVFTAPAPEGVGEAGELNTILAHCLAHARRRFVEVENMFPKEV